MSGEKVVDAGGDAAVSADDATNGDTVKDTYVDTLNLWVYFLTSVHLG